MLNKSKKIKILTNFVTLFLFIIEHDFENFNNKRKFITRNDSIKAQNIEAFFKCNIKNYSILIFEHNPYHYECTPGFTKYFLDLGYNIDIIMHRMGQDTFCLFENVEKIRLFIFDNFDKIIDNSEKFSLVIHNYDYLLVESTNISGKEIYKKLGLFKMCNSIFVLHNVFYIIFYSNKGQLYINQWNVIIFL